MDYRSLLRTAQQRGRVPRVHGNGFIQLNINTLQRMHLWGHPGIPAQKTPSPIHNHIFNFTSQVLKGALTNVIYQPRWREDGLFSEWRPEPRDGEDTVLVRTGRRCDLDTVGSLTHRTAYMASGNAFHETLVHEPTITLMTKTKDGEPTPEKASVLVRGFNEPDNDFVRHAFDTGALWDTIWEIAA